VKCPQCSKDVVGDRGLIQHVRQAHPKKDGRANREPKVFCGVCGHGLGSMKSLDAHGYQQHHGGGHARKEWLTQPESAVPLAPPKLDVVTDLVIDVDEPRSDPELCEELNAKDAAVVGRKWPVAADRHNAETLAGLPWLTFPTTVEQCDDALNGIAIGIERTQIASPFWLSLRSYIAALRKRLAEKVAA
jgi:hypothetical protein